MDRGEAFISVDIEASGPTPGTGSLISIGCCPLEDLTAGFYRELRPIAGHRWDVRAERVHGLSQAHLADHGSDPKDAIRDLIAWITEVAQGRSPVFVGFNAPFDWMFVAEYCHRFAGRNPFGISALDLKSLYMGREGVAAWRETRKVHILERYPTQHQSTHNALDDARAQGELAALLLAPSGLVGGHSQDVEAGVHVEDLTGDGR